MGLAPVSLVLWLCALPAASTAQSEVLQLWDSNFDELIEDHETMLVHFYTPWCIYCRHLAPEYEKAASRLKGTALFAQVDCSTSTKTCGRFGIDGYPTLKIFKNGKESSTYKGPRSEEGIVYYIQKQIGPSSTILHTEEELNSFINHFDASVVGFFINSNNTQLDEFQKTADTLRDNYRFAHTMEPGLGLPHGLEGEGVLLFRPPRLKSIFEENVEKYTGSINASALQKFIKNKIFGICPHVTKENRYKLRRQDLLTAYYNVDYIRDPKGSNYWRNRVLKVAIQFQSQGLNFAIANRQEFKKELEEEFGIGMLGEEEFPVITIRTREGHKYAMQEEFMPDGKALKQFLENYFAGRLKRYMKSQPAPEHNKGPVKVVVTDTFDEIVNDPEKDVLIQLYAPYSGHCKSLEPKYNNLAEQLSGNSNIVIAKMDATANDVPAGYEVDGFPTIYFTPAKKKAKPIRYQGEYEMVNLLRFVRRESSRHKVQRFLREDL